MVTRLYSHPIFLEHVTPPGHPERADRLRAIEKVLAHDVFDPLDRVDAPMGDSTTLLYAHPREYVDRVYKTTPKEGMARIDADTSMSPKSWEAALTAVGAANAAVDDVFEGRADNVFVASRPPGHHAERNKAMGFCLFNNAAIAARHAQKKHGAERVAIVDWDVHHGNGTQDIFWSDRRCCIVRPTRCRFIRAPARLSKPASAISSTRRCRQYRLAIFRDAFRSRVLPAIDKFRPGPDHHFGRF
jgi:acetoin utilization deacetylase AcuC-like enzyme